LASGVVGGPESSFRRLSAEGLNYRTQPPLLLQTRGKWKYGCCCFLGLATLVVKQLEILRMIQCYSSRPAIRAFCILSDLVKPLPEVIKMGDPMTRPMKEQSIVTD
ncbi:hypothetical protein HAX54_002734, partial [Datura stramonium]|nr:hypothetical protein [Datura stramonium]